MLSKYLKKEDCALCGFCCSFRRKSLWELPKLPLCFEDKYSRNYAGDAVCYRRFESEKGKWLITYLEDKYKTDDPEEEVICPFLDPQSGCTLPPEDKPFECSAWPLRYMEMPDGAKKLCVATGCPVIGRAGTGSFDETDIIQWEKMMKDHAEDNPFIIGKYEEGYEVLQICTSTVKE